MVKRKKLLKVNGNTYARMIALLMDDEYTLHEITRIIGYHYVTVCHYVRELRKVGCIYVSSWKRDTHGRVQIAAYRLGRHQNAPRPRAKTPAERWRAMKERRKGNGLVRAWPMAEGA